MRLEREHGTTKADAVKRLDTLLARLREREWPMGIKIADDEARWSGDNDRMDFSFKLKKGFVKVTVAGHVDVDDTHAAIEADVPRAVKTLVSEDKIADVIVRHFDRLFDEG